MLLDCSLEIILLWLIGSAVFNIHKFAGQLAQSCHWISTPNYVYVDDAYIDSLMGAMADRPNLKLFDFH